MAGYLRLGTAVLLLVCFISQSYSHLSNTAKALNHADKHKYPDCDSLLKAGYNVSGVYRLTLNGKDIKIPCEFKDNQAYVVVLRRMSDDGSFGQPWFAYENGFGNLSYNFWAGLAAMYSLNQQGYTTLIINFVDFVSSYDLVYYNFTLEDRTTRYRMHAGTYKGIVPDDLSYQNNMSFATIDVPDPNGCAVDLKAGWWYNQCSHALPTGKYYNGGFYTPTGKFYDGIYWKSLDGYNYSMPYISMTMSTLTPPFRDYVNTNPSFP